MTHRWNGNWLVCDDGAEVFARARIEPRHVGLGSLGGYMATVWTNAGKDALTPFDGIEEAKRGVEMFLGIASGEP